MYKLIKILNNNAVLVHEDASLCETILLGKGIAFKKTITSADYDKRFQIADESDRTKYLNLFTTIDPDVIGITDDLMQRAETVLGPLQPSSFNVICGHLDFARRRFQAHESLENVLLNEIIALYPSEYAVASEVRPMMRERLGVEIDADEIGFIALHLNASRLSQDVKDSLRTANVSKRIIEMTQQLDAHEASQLTLFNRINYISLLLNRLRAGEPAIAAFPAIFLTHINDELHIARQIATTIHTELELVVSEHEIGYLAMHLHQYRV